jgi:hypothetical protein
MDASAPECSSAAEHQDAIDAIALRLHDLPLCVWSNLVDQGGLEVADLISLQRSCKSLNMKPSDTTASTTIIRNYGFSECACRGYGWAANEPCQKRRRTRKHATKATKFTHLPFLFSKHEKVSVIDSPVPSSRKRSPPPTTDT